MLHCEYDGHSERSFGFDSELLGKVTPVLLLLDGQNEFNSGRPTVVEHFDVYSN